LSESLSTEVGIEGGGIGARARVVEGHSMSECVVKKGTKKREKKWNRRV
jgi:hypothetical protein